jgi:hypothetical protein
MDIGNVEANTILLKKTIKYLPDGTEKEQVKKQIRYIFLKYFGQMRDLQRLVML